MKMETSKLGEKILLRESNKKYRKEQRIKLIPFLALLCILLISIIFLFYKKPNMNLENAFVIILITIVILAISIYSFKFVYSRQRWAISKDGFAPTRRHVYSASPLKKTLPFYSWHQIDYITIYKGSSYSMGADKWITILHKIGNHQYFCFTLLLDLDEKILEKLFSNMNIDKNKIKFFPNSEEFTKWIHSNNINLQHIWEDTCTNTDIEVHFESRTLDNKDGAHSPKCRVSKMASDVAINNLKQKGKFIDYATFTVMSIGEAFSTLLILIVLIIVIYYGIYFLFRNFWWSMILLFGCGTCIVYCVIIQMNSHFRPKLKIFEKGFQICIRPKNWFLFSPRPLFENFIPYSEIKKIYITKKHHGYGFYVELLIIKTSSGEYIVQNIDNERDVNNQDKYNLHPTNIRKIKNILHKHLREYKESKGHTAV